MSSKYITHCYTLYLCVKPSFPGLPALCCSLSTYYGLYHDALFYNSTGNGLHSFLYIPDAGGENPEQTFNHEIMFLSVSPHLHRGPPQASQVVFFFPLSLSAGFPLSYNFTQSGKRPAPTPLGGEGKHHSVKSCFSSCATARWYNEYRHSKNNSKFPTHLQYMNFKLQKSKAS